MDISKIEELLAEEASYLLNHTSKTITKDKLIHLPPTMWIRFGIILIETIEYWETYNGLWNQVDL